MLESQVAYYQVFAPEQFHIHPNNRGGLMLNNLDVHDKGNTMVKTGVQLNKLVDSVAFKLSNDPAKETKQLDKNIQLAAANNGMLAPVSGAARFLTAGASHTVAFCKAVNAACVSNMPKLSSTGFLSLATILAKRQISNEDRRFKSRCADGWKWLIVASFVEDLHPELPALIQLSLNSSHSV